MSRHLTAHYRFLRAVVRLLTRAFFKEIVCEGAERVPEDAGGLVIAWHPNGLVDPALILANFPGRIVFGARHGLFRWPIIGWLMRSIGTVPIYRAQDTSKLTSKDRREANEASLEALATELASGSYSALFPEGLSHDEPHVSEVKTGAARLYYRAVELSATDANEPVIIPVGLHYDRKEIFRSRALVWFHEPMRIPDDLTAAPGQPVSADRRREMLRGLTSLIEETLIEVARSTDDWDLHHLMHRLRKMLRAERSGRAGKDPGPPSIAERELGFARVWYTYQAWREKLPAEIEKLRAAVAAYDRDLEAIGLEDHELSIDPRLASPWWLALSVLQFVLVFLLLPPILVAGYVINIVPYYLLKGVTRLVAKQTKDLASVKIIGGALLFPSTWALAAYLAAKAHHELHLMFPTIPDVPIVAAVTTVVLGIAGGLIALVYFELSSDTWRAIRVRVTRRRQREAVASLCTRRSQICERVERRMLSLADTSEGRTATRRTE
ncbi:MAG: 1-acyl-sn-glycerol-3-phosphate acyltransferase [Rhodothermales bacterium]|nr:1-acyl-sn-glycerol-3-phosphate acyltransferase [Rhodothermales bacterium]